jgi:hypothetical protein
MSQTPFDEICNYGIIIGCIVGICILLWLYVRMGIL